MNEQKIRKINKLYLAQNNGAFPSNYHILLQQCSPSKLTIQQSGRDNTVAIMKRNRSSYTNF